MTCEAVMPLSLVMVEQVSGGGAALAAELLAALLAGEAVLPLAAAVWLPLLPHAARDTRTGAKITEVFSLSLNRSYGS